MCATALLLSPRDVRDPIPTMGGGSPRGTCRVGRASWDSRPQASRGTERPDAATTLTERDDGTFAIDADSGNLTMTGVVRSPKTFTLLVKVGPRPGLQAPLPSSGLRRPPLQNLLVTAASPTPRASRPTTPATR